MSNKQIEAIRKEIKLHPSNSWAIEKGFDPLFTAHPKAKIVIIGQAPGLQTHKNNTPWDDQSGKRLKEWLGVTDEVFYDEEKFALIPMDFYYPGKGKSGDLPPRKEFAPMWHPILFDLLKNIELKILIGGYAQKYYLKQNPYKTLTETVLNYKDFELIGSFPLVHPSPRNVYWMQKNPWFREEVVPQLQKQIHRLT